MQVLYMVFSICYTWQTLPRTIYMYVCKIRWNVHSYNRTIQNFGERKFWRNSSYQKLADNILANAHANQFKILFTEAMSAVHIRCHYAMLMQDSCYGFTKYPLVFSIKYFTMHAANFHGIIVNSFSHYDLIWLLLRSFACRGYNRNTCLVSRPYGLWISRVPETLALSNFVAAFQVKLRV